MATCVATETLPDSEMSDDCVWPLGHSWLSDGAPGRPSHTESASPDVSWTPLSASHSDTVVTAADNPSSSPLSWININNSLRIITHKCPVPDCSGCSAAEIPQPHTTRLVTTVCCRGRRASCSACSRELQDR